MVELENHLPKLFSDSAVKAWCVHRLKCNLKLISFWGWGTGLMPRSWRAECCIRAKIEQGLRGNLGAQTALQLLLPLLIPLPHGTLPFYTSILSLLTFLGLDCRFVRLLSR